MAADTAELRLMAADAMSRAALIDSLAAHVPAELLAAVRASAGASLQRRRPSTGRWHDLPGVIFAAVAKLLGARLRFGLEPVCTAWRANSRMRGLTELDCREFGGVVRNIR
jgi:hypothetical protein